MKYINILAGIRFYGIVIIVSIFGIYFLFALCRCIISGISDLRKTKLLKKYGCKRYLKGVASVGDGCWYGWKTEDYAFSMDERDIERISYKELKNTLHETVYVEV